jgi:hypothetical protein
MPTWEPLPTDGAVEDADLLEFADHRLRRTAEEFDLDREGWPSQFMLYWHAGRSGRRIIPGDPPGCLIYLQEGADWHQAHYLLGHEITHAVLLPDRTAFDWVQEMFAQHCSIRGLLELGEQAYAKLAIDQLHKEAANSELTTEAMLVLDLEAEDVPGIYPKSFEVGAELIEAVSWAKMKPLARMFNEQGKHDVPGWVNSLDPEDQKAAEGVLYGT